MVPTDGTGPAATVGAAFGGRWRYDRRAGRGIALSYERALRDGRGRWRFDRRAGRGIAVSYERGRPAPEPPAAIPEPPAAVAPPPPAPAPAPLPPENLPGDGSGLRVLCYCGELFTLDGDRGTCPSCGRFAEWPTTRDVESEMRADLDELLASLEPDE